MGILNIHMVESNFQQPNTQSTASTPKKGAYTTRIFSRKLTTDVVGQFIQLSPMWAENYPSFALYIVWELGIPREERKIRSEGRRSRTVYILQIQRVHVRENFE